MNPSVSCCSSEERGEQNNWVCETINTMSVGLETARQFHGRQLDWEWPDHSTTGTLNNNNGSTNPSRAAVQADSDDHKPHILPPPTVSSFRHYNNIPALGFSGHHSLGILNSSRMQRASFGDSNSGLPTSLLYPEMPSFAYDSRSQLAQMMGIHGNSNSKHGGGGGGGVGGCGGGVYHDIVKREDLEYQATMLNLGHRAYFSSHHVEDSAVSRLYKRSRALPPSSQVPRCQAEGCKTDLTHAKHYHRRHKVCEFHSKAATVITGGLHQRFCQQCSRFHALSEFDEAKRSCRKRLADHNRRRRKPQANAVSSNTEAQAAAAALKGEEDDQNSNKNVSGSSDTTRGGQVAAAAAAAGRPESQALMSAMSLPLMLQNSKTEISPNPNSATPNCNTNPNNTALQQQQQEQQQQYNQNHNHSHNNNSSCQRTQNGPNLSMGLCNGRTQAQAEYSGLELALPWLRAGSDQYNHHHHHHHHHHRPSTPMDILQPLHGMSDKSDVDGYSNSMQNFLPISTSSSRAQEWSMVGNSDDQESGQEHEQQIFSLLESPAGVRTEEDSSAAVEYLSHRRHNHHHHNHGGLGLNSKETTTMQSLRPFGQSIYDSTL